MRDPIKDKIDKKLLERGFKDEESGFVCQGYFVTTYCIETGGDDSGSWCFSAGIVHFGEGVADFSDSVNAEGFFEAIF